VGRRDDTGFFAIGSFGKISGLTLFFFRKSFITFMDALRLRLRAKDQLHPILQELVTGYARFKGSKDWEGRSKMVGWYVFRAYFVSSLHLFQG
jgi:hypothetical protein